MKNIKIVLFVILVAILSMSTYGQEENYQYKVSNEKLPVAVKNEIKKYEGYKVISAAYKIEKDKKNYRLQIAKGKLTHVLIVDETGKIIGREEN